MARIRSTPPSASQESRDALIEAVVKALRDEEQADDLVIFEVPSGDTDYFEVIVVWERWSELPADVRTRVVTQAYQRLEAQSPDAVSLDKISMILPVTVEQALEIGILPYSVQSSVHRSAADYDRIAKLMKREGAIETDAGTELRLPTLQTAKEARDRLHTETRDMAPEVHWQISQQVGRIVDY